MINKPFSYAEWYERWLRRFWLHNTKLGKMLIASAKQMDELS